MYHFYGCSFSYAAQWSCMARCSLMERRRKSRTSTYCLYIWAITRGLWDFFSYAAIFIYIKWSLGLRACHKHSVLAYLSFVNYNGRDFACCRPAFPYTCIITERVLALMVLCSVWPYSQKLTTIQCSQGKVLSLSSWFAIHSTEAWICHRTSAVTLGSVHIHYVLNFLTPLSKSFSPRGQQSIL